MGGEDELDDLIEKAFGPTTTEVAGRFDVGLLAAGAALVASWIVTGSREPWLPFAIALVVLGAALPLRGALLAANARRRDRRDDG
jgi:hypothetical protein